VPKNANAASSNAATRERWPGARSKRSLNCLANGQRKLAGSAAEACRGHPKNRKSLEKLEKINPFAVAGGSGLNDSAVPNSRIGRRVGLFDSDVAFWVNRGHAKIT
jgi:hypothetical protein